MGGITQRPWTPTKRRGPIAAEHSSPGPACVTLPTTIGNVAPDSKKGRAPAFSFGGRHNMKDESPGPGPGQYNVTGLSAKGLRPLCRMLAGKDSSQASTLHGRHKEPRPDNFPAPGDYSPEKSEQAVNDCSPKYTFGVKTQSEKPSSTPAPNVYNMPSVLGAVKEGHRRQAPSFTISGRTKEPVDERILIPGPGAYNNASPEQYKTRRSPCYSMSSRHQIPSDSTQKPGPGVYSPEKVNLDIKPAHTFGIKHSPYIGHLKAHLH